MDTECKITAAITEELERMKKEGTLVPLDLYSNGRKVNNERVGVIEKCVVDPLCVYESRYIETIMLRDRSSVSSTVIGKKTLDMVLEFCKERAVIRCVFNQKGEQFIRDALEFFDSTYLERKLSSASLHDLIQILRAACELKVRSLVDLMTGVIVEKVDKKSSRQIRKIFNLWGKISQKDIQGQMELDWHSWAFVNDQPSETHAV